MSSLNTLLESANQYKTLQSDAMRLSKKWAKTGLLENLGTETEKNNMAMLLENQAKQLIQESSITGGGFAGGNAGIASVGEQWAGIALPLVRKVFAQISAKEFVSVQPMNLPSGLIFFLDFQYGTTKAPFKAGESVYGTNRDDKDRSPFGHKTEGGLYGEGRYTYSINNAEVVATGMSAAAAVTAIDVEFDPVYAARIADLSKYTVPVGTFKNADFTGIRGWALAEFPEGAKIVQRFTKLTSEGNVQFVVEGENADSLTADTVIAYQLQPTSQYRGDFEDNNPSLNPANSPAIHIPEINMSMKSSDITAKTRKLKAVWTPEFAQDLNAYHAIDAEAELTAMLSEYISLEIDLEILDMLMVGAAGGNEIWTVKNNTSLNPVTGAVTNDNLGFFNSMGSWFQTIGTKVQKLSNQIHQNTFRGGANFMVISPKVSTIFESIPGFAASTDGDAMKSNYTFGAQKIGTMNGRMKIYKNPYMTENKILLGFKGSQFLESGAVFAPYVPIIQTPLVYDPETFTPRKGLMTRYGKKMVRPEYFATITVADLDLI